MNVSSLESVKLNDDIVEGILIRSALLKKINREQLAGMIIKRIKPFMTPEEVIHVDMKVEFMTEELL